MTGEEIFFGMNIFYIMAGVVAILIGVLYIANKVSKK